MRQLDELALRTLSELEEAGEENIPTILNSILEPAGASEQLLVVKQSLEDLIDAGLVSIAIERDPSRRWKPLPQDKALEITGRMASEITYRKADNHWTFVGSARPQLVITQDGRIEASRVLRERGTGWWRAER